MDNMTILSVFLVSVPEAILVAALGLVLAGVRPRFRQLVLLGFGQAGVAYLVRLSPVPFGIHTFILALAFVVLIRIIVRADWRVALIAGLLGLTVYGAIETACAPVLLYLTGHTFLDVVPHPYLRILFFVPEALILALLLWLCLRFNFRPLQPLVDFGYTKGEWRFLNRSYFLVYFLAVLPVLLLTTLNMVLMNVQIGVFPSGYLPVFCSCMALAILVITTLMPLKIRTFGSAVARASAARETAEDLAHIADLLKLVRRQQHDFGHQLHTIYGLLESGYHNDAKQFIRTTYHTAAAPLELVRTDHIHMMALLYTKLTLATSKSVRLDVNVEGSAKDLPLTPFEIASLFGNLLDNAIDAVEDMPPEERVVCFEMVFERGEYVISVANPGNLESPKIQSRLFRKNYTSKKGHSGIGLTIVQDIVAKYKGSITVSCSDGQVLFRVVIPLLPEGTATEGEVQWMAG